MSRVAVVTGAASGMGLAISRRLADEGSRVALLDLDGDAADQAADDLRGTGAQAIAAKVDVTDRGAVDEALQRVRTELGPVEIMVTSAGLDEFVAFTDITTAQWERMIAVNLTGVFHSVQAHYVASKGGVIGLTKALAAELGPHGITVNTIPPGSIDTPMTRRAQDTGALPSTDAIAKMIPVRRTGTPDDVAATCAFLCSDEAAYITGQQINVSGGRYM